MDQIRPWNEFYKTQNRAWRGVADLGGTPFDAGSRILEVGCGNGKTLAALLESGFEAVGIDFSEEAVEACKRYLGHGIEVKCASVLDIPFPDGSFDGAVMFHVLEALTSEEAAKASAELKRVVKKGGFIIARAFAIGDLRSEKGERISEDTVVRGNGIRYRYYTEESMIDAFPDAECISIRTSEEPTRFGGIRSKVDAVFRMPRVPAHSFPR